MLCLGTRAPPLAPHRTHQRLLPTHAQEQPSTAELRLESNLVVYEAIGRRIADHMDADTVADALQRDGVDPAAFDLTA